MSTTNHKGPRLSDGATDPTPRAPLSRCATPRPKVATYDEFKERYEKGLGLKIGTFANQFCAAMSAGFVYSVSGGCR